jgi:hypothetical protein
VAGFLSAVTNEADFEQRFKDVLLVSFWTGLRSQQVGSLLQTLLHMYPRVLRKVIEVAKSSNKHLRLPPQIRRKTQGNPEAEVPALLEPAQLLGGCTHIAALTSMRLGCRPYLHDGHQRRTLRAG